MPPGKVEAIFIAPNRGDPTISIEQAHIIPGMGIAGDRYFGMAAKKDPNAKPGREITLIEIEAIDAIRNEDGIQITPGQTRRNIITSGVSLNALVGRIFRIGSLQLRGIRLCEPCDYLANRTDPRIKKSMTHRGGLRAEIITEGIIRLNDIITITE